MPWIYLILAGILEAVWAIGLKYTHGFSRPGPSILVGSAILGSMFLLSLALKTIPVGMGYAMWVGIGIFGAAISGPIIFAQPLRPIQLLFLGLLLVAIIGLRTTDASAS